MLKRSPIIPEITFAMVAEESDGFIENGKKFEINSAVIILKIYPITSELVVKIIASTKNWNLRSDLVAPILRLIPISKLLSPTEVNIISMTPFDNN